MNQLILTYRELGQQVRSNLVNLTKIENEQNVKITETEVRSKPLEFQDKSYKAFNVTLDSKTYYADFLTKE